MMPQERTCSSWGAVPQTRSCSTHAPAETWESKPLRLVRAKPPSASVAPKSCVQLQVKMYLWMDSDEIHVYSPSSDHWSALTAPSRDASDEYEFRGLGHWAGVLFVMTKNKRGTLSVWKLNMVDKQWSEYAQIPRWLFAQPGTVMPIVACHCNGCLLMHVLRQPEDVASQPKTTRLEELLNYSDISWRVPMNLGREFVLLDIANRRWVMVDMPNSEMWKEE